MGRKIPMFRDMALGKTLGDLLDKYEEEIYEPACSQRLHKAKFLLDNAIVEQRIDERFKEDGRFDDAQSEIL